MFVFEHMSFTSVYEVNGLDIDGFFYARNVHDATHWCNYDFLFNLNVALSKTDFGPGLSNINVRFGPSLDASGEKAYIYPLSGDDFLLGMYVPESQLSNYAQYSGQGEKISLRAALEKLEDANSKASKRRN